MANPVVHFEIIGNDVAGLGRFYGDLFDWNVRPVEGMDGYSLVDTGSEGAIGGGIGASDDGRSLVTFYVEVDDPQAYLDKAESLGATTILSVTEIPNMVTFALFADPEGHAVGVVKSEAGSS
jgi:predicted enzyme related to lactoylglutathione lyase